MGFEPPPVREAPSALDLTDYEYKQIFAHTEPSAAKEYFGTQVYEAPEYLTEKYRWIPFNKLSQAPVGPDFEEVARNLGDLDRASKTVGTFEEKVTVETSFPLKKLYLQALYAPATFYLTLQYKGRNQGVRVIPGHYWGFDRPGPHDPPGEGPRVMVIGKHPAAEEAQAGRNFFGPTGVFFQECLEKLGVPWEETARWYVTNLVRWQNIDPKGGALPARWIKDCLPLLKQEIKIIRPEYILCVGAEATKMICGGNNNLRNMFGRWIEHKYYAGPPNGLEEECKAKVMAITQPKYVMMNTDAMPMFENTLRNFVQLTRNQEFTDGTERFKIHYLHSEAQLKDYVDHVLATNTGIKRIAVDAEWHGQHPSNDGSYLRTIQLCHDGLNAAVVVLRASPTTAADAKEIEDAEAKGLEVDPELNPARVTFGGGVEGAARQIMRLLDRDDIQIVGHYFASDMPWLIENGMDLRHRFRVPADIDEIRNCNGYFAGGVDTGLAAHAHEETADFKLEVLCSRYLGAKRWDTELNEWKKGYCHRQGLKDAELEGYGMCEFAILGPYSGFDVIHDWRLADRYLRKDGMLDNDRYENSSWVPFHISMLAFPGFLEMGYTGVKVDRTRIDQLTDLYYEVRNDRLGKLRDAIDWQDFNPRSPQHCRELLFGEDYNGKKRANDGSPRDGIIRPEGVDHLHLTPIKTTGNKSIPWERVKGRSEEAYYTPSTDAESLGILGADNDKAMMLRDVRFLDQVMKSVLRPPPREYDSKGKCTGMTMEGGHRKYSGGIATFICDDGRIRSTFQQTKETGRASSARPPLQNLSKRRETDYRRIQGDNYKWKIRSFIISDYESDDPTVLLETDYGGAELLGMAVMSRSQTMISHCLDPDYDIHSHVAVDAFGLTCPPIKASFDGTDVEGLRVAAKNIIFGVGYGRGAEACARQCKEEGNDITTEQAQTIINTIFNMYPEIPDFQLACQRRVTDPGWMRNNFGRFRRFIPPNDQAALAGLQREAMNFPMQSMVADAVSWALHWLYNHPRKAELGYKIVLQIHDAIVLEVPVRSLDVVYNEIIPECMVERVPFYATDLDGMRYADKTAYRFPIERDVQIRWGEKLTTEQLDHFGLDHAYAHAA